MWICKQACSSSSSSNKDKSRYTYFATPRDLNFNLDYNLLDDDSDDHDDGIYSYEHNDGLRDGTQARGAGRAARMSAHHKGVQQARFFKRSHQGRQVPRNQ